MNETQEILIALQKKVVDRVVLLFQRLTTHGPLIEKGRGANTQRNSPGENSHTNRYDFLMRALSRLSGCATRYLT